MKIVIRQRPKDLLSLVTGQDMDTAVRTAYGEVRGEFRDGWQAFFNVLINRHLADIHEDNKPDWWGESLHEVCLKPWQFSCWNAGDPNREKCVGLGRSSVEYLRLQAMLVQCLDGWLPNNVHLCTHYKVSGLPMPESWAGLEPWGAIGRHTFFYYPEAHFG